jgi:hypothetical protein
MSELDRDIALCKKYENGELIDECDRISVRRLESLGLMRIGTRVVKKGDKVRLCSTAQTTVLGKRLSGV